MRCFRANANRGLQGGMLDDATRNLTDEAGTTTQANAAMAFAMWRAKVAVEFTPGLAISQCGVV